MHFDDFTQEEKDYFVEKFGDLIIYCGNNAIDIEDACGEYFILLKYPCHKGTIYLLQVEDDPDGMFEVNDGVWMPNSQYVYYEITKEGINQFASEHEDGCSLKDYTLNSLGR